MIRMIETIFKNKTTPEKLSTKTVIRTLQNKFGKKTQINVFLNSNGIIEKIEIGKKLTSSDKNWVKDKYPELS